MAAGRELAYVAMSRARQSSTAWVVADDLDQATEDLDRDWGTRRTPTWAIDTGLPDPRPETADGADLLGREQRSHILAIDQARHRTQARALAHAPTCEMEAQLASGEAILAEMRSALADLPAGEGAYRDTAIGRAVDDYLDAAADLHRLQTEVEQGSWGRRRQAARQLPAVTASEQAAGERVRALIEPERNRLEQIAENTDRAVSVLQSALGRQQRRQAEHDRQAAQASVTARRTGEQLIQTRRLLDRPAQRRAPAQLPPQVAIPEPMAVDGPDL